MVDAAKPFAGKSALVTGSSKGIGRAIALRFAMRGADIVVNYNTDEAAGRAVVAEAETYGVLAHLVRADVSKVADIKRLFDESEHAMGKLDIVVANAGIEKVNIPVVDVSETAFDLLHLANSKGPFFVMQEAARRVSDGGRILNISSSSTVRPQAGLGLYGTSKTAPKYLAKVLALELAGRGVTVNSLLPGPIDDAGIFTGVAGDDPYKKALRESDPGGRLGTVTDVANFAEFLCSDASALITGEEILMNGGSAN